MLFATRFHRDTTIRCSSSNPASCRFLATFCMSIRIVEASIGDHDVPSVRGGGFYVEGSPMRLAAPTAHFGRLSGANKKVPPPNVERSRAKYAARSPLSQAIRGRVFVFMNSTLSSLDAAYRKALFASLFLVLTVRRLADIICIL